MITAPSAWATGSKSAMMFTNSNVRAYNVPFRFAPTRKDVVTIRYAHVTASELRSPVQSGRATRLDLTDDVGAVISGFTDARLSDDAFIEYFPHDQPPHVPDRRLQCGQTGQRDHRGCRPRPAVDRRIRQCRAQLLNVCAPR
jgi:hypothetical protein